jgi:hypothetical protein
MATYLGGGGGDTTGYGNLAIPPHDYISNTYSGSNLTETVFKRGGASGTVVATLTMTYDGSGNLLTVTRS